MTEASRQPKYKNYNLISGLISALTRCRITPRCPRPTLRTPGTTATRSFSRTSSSWFVEDKLKVS